MLLNMENTTSNGQLNFAYKGKWRSYQTELFERLEINLTAPRINIVAPLAANRFDVALELIGRIGQNALIITNSNSTRSIWRSRINSHFLDSQYRDSVSTNIRLPKNVTIITYQNLVNAFYGQSSEYEPHFQSINSKFRIDKAEEIIKILKNTKVDTLCFDEPNISNGNLCAMVSFLIDNLTPLHQITVSETLPQCKSVSEYDKYEELFGKVQEIIGLDTLYKNNLLAPYQDFVYFSDLSDREKELIDSLNERICDFLPVITQNKTLINKLYSSPYMKHPEKHSKEIYKDLLFFTSVASLFKSKSYVIPDSFMDLLEAEDYDIPDFRATEAQYFVSGLINNSEKFPELEDEITEIKNLLVEYNLLDNYSLLVESSPATDKIITSSTGKVSSVAEISNAELISLGKDLKILVLTDDYEQLDRFEESTNVLSVLNQMNKINYRFKSALISNDLILIPSSVLDNFYDILKAKYISKENVSVLNFEPIDNFVSVQAKDSVRNAVVRSIIKMSDVGILNTIIATDDTFTEEHNLSNFNTLILTSNDSVNSIKVRNQILNHSLDDPEKIVHIWHLCTAYERNSDAMFIRSFKQLLVRPSFNLLKVTDFNKIKIKFEYLSGLDLNTLKISNSIKRILPPNYSINSVNDLLKLNTGFLRFAKDRKHTKANWEMIITNNPNTNLALMEGLETKHELHPLMYQTGYYYLLTIVLLACLLTVYIRPQLFIFSVLLAFGTLLIPTIRVFSRATSSNMTKTVCRIILKTLYKQGNILTKPNKVVLNIINNLDGTKFIYTKSLTQKENHIFVKCLYDFFSTIGNPTYLIVRRNHYLGLIDQKDYHALPEIFAEQKSVVLKFKSFWRHSLGCCNIYFTGVEDGNILLLRAHKRMLLEKKYPPSRITHRWL